jgi:hypothetical protein
MHGNSLITRTPERFPPSKGKKKVEYILFHIQRGKKVEYYIIHTTTIYFHKKNTNSALMFIVSNTE